MKKKSLLSLIILIMAFASASFVSADYTKIYDKWQSYDTSFTAEGTAYRARINTIYHDQMVLTVNDANHLLRLENCKNFESFKYCYDNQTMDRPEATISDDGYAVPAVKLVIWQDKTLTSSIQVKNTFPVLGYELKETEMEVVITNKGTTYLENTVYTLFVPENITITNPDDFTLKGNTLTKQLNLGPDKSFTYNFKFIPKEYGTHNLVYNYNYTADGAQKTVKGTTKVTSTSPYELVLPKLSSNYDVTDQVRFPVTIKNNHPSQNLIIKKITITGPQEHNYGFMSSLTSKGPSTFEGEGTVNPGREKDFLLTVYPVYAGTFKINVDVDFELEGKPLSTEKNVTIKSDIKDFQAKIYFDKSSALPGDTVKLTFYYYNSHSTNNLIDADLKVQSSIFNETYIIGNMLAGSQDNVMLKTFQVPPRERDEKATFKAELKYKTETGQIIRKNYSETISIAGSGKIIQITQKIDKKIAAPGDEILVEVKAKNLRDQLYQNVKFEETLPEGTITSDDTTKILSFTPMEEKSIYAYKLNISPNYEFNRFNITSTAKIESLLYETSVSTVLTINGSQLKPLPVENITKNITPNNVTVQPVEKKPGFFVRVFKSIESFFTKLFTKK